MEKLYQKSAEKRPLGMLISLVAGCVFASIGLVVPLAIATLIGLALAIAEPLFPAEDYEPDPSRGEFYGDGIPRTFGGQPFEPLAGYPKPQQEGDE